MSNVKNLLKTKSFEEIERDAKKEKLYNFLHDFRNQKFKNIIKLKIGFYKKIIFFIFYIIGSKKSNIIYYIIWLSCFLISLSKILINNFNNFYHIFDQIFIFGIFIYLFLIFLRGILKFFYYRKWKTI